MIEDAVAEYVLHIETTALPLHCPTQQGSESYRQSQIETPPQYGIRHSSSFVYRAVWV